MRAVFGLKLTDGAGDAGLSEDAAEDGWRCAGRTGVRGGGDSNGAGAECGGVLRGGVRGGEEDGDLSVEAAARAPANVVGVTSGPKSVSEVSSASKRLLMRLLLAGDSVE